MKRLIFIILFITGCSSKSPAPEVWNPVDANEARAFLEYSGASKNFCLSVNDETEACKDNQMKHAGAILEWTSAFGIANCLPYKVSSSKASCRSKLSGSAIEHCHEINRSPDQKSYDFTKVFTCVNKRLAEAKSKETSN